MFNIARWVFIIGCEFFVELLPVLKNRYCCVATNQEWFQKVVTDQWRKQAGRGTFHFCKPLNFVLGVPKCKFLLGIYQEKAFHAGKKSRKVTYPLSYAAVTDYTYLVV